MVKIKEVISVSWILRINAMQKKEKKWGKLKAFYLFNSLLELSTVDHNYCKFQS